MEESRIDIELQLKLKQLSVATRKKAEGILLSGKKLRAIGYWIGSGNTELPHPQNFQDLNWNAIEKQMVIDYLQKGTIAIAYMGLSWCRFECGELNMGASDLSDGIYCWPEGLVHYIEKHSVRLPEEFIEHIKKK
jgi:hypothetical protein